MHQPIFDNIEREFGDLIALLNERDIGPQDKVMRLLIASAVGIVAASAAGYLLAAWVI